MPTRKTSPSALTHSCEEVYLRSEGMDMMYPVVDWCWLGMERVVGWRKSDQGLAIAHERRPHHLGGQPLAADFNLDAVAGLRARGYPRQAYGYSHGGRHAATGDFTVSGGGADLHVAPHDAALEELQPD